MSDWRIYLEFIDGSSKKFWRGKVDGTSVTTNWGRLGTDGQSKDKDYASADAAVADLEKQATKKRAKGYVDAGGAVAEAAEVEEAAADLPSSVALAQDLGGRKIELQLEVDGNKVRTIAVEAYDSEAQAKAALSRLADAMVEDGYSRV